MKTKVGTPFYVAPEVLQGEYKKSCDMWSIGVIAYLLLSGYPPFYGDNNDEIFDKIESCEYTFPKKEWEGVSKNAKSFIRKLLVLNPDKRMTPDEALNHPWLTTKNNPQDATNTQLISRLKKFQAPRRFQNEFLLYLADFIEEEQMKKILESLSAHLSQQQLRNNDPMKNQSIAETNDVENSEWISIEELKNALNDVVSKEKTLEILDK